MAITWSSVNSRSYFLERAIDLGSQPAFLTVATNITGLAGATTYSDTNAPGVGACFYRVGVRH